MNIKACVFDIDGTLYDYRCQKIHDSTLQGVRALQEEGILVIIASARSFAEMNREIQCDLKADYFIGASGQSILDQNRRSIFSERFTLPQTERVVSLAARYSAGLTLKYDQINCLYLHPEQMRCIYANIGESICPSLVCGEMNHHQKELPIGFTVWGPDGILDQLQNELKRFPQDYRLELFKNSAVADIFHPMANKLTALRHLCAELQIDAKNVAAFGDGANDIELIRWAGFGVAMGNAREELKAAADYVCEPAWEHGIGSVIHKMILAP